MIGIIPSSTKTFEVEGMFTAAQLTEGKLYADPDDERVYYYSTSQQRSNPSTGYFPIWNGTKKFVSKYSNKKYLGKDVIKTDIEHLCQNISNTVASNIRYLHRRSTNDDILQPAIRDNDNMFTQVIKGVIGVKKLTIIDLVDMSKLDEHVIRNYYVALTKIAFMRIERWEIWINQIFHLRYTITIFRGDKQLLSYSYPDNTFDCGIVCYDNIINSQDDPFKKIVKVLMIMENINKNDLRSNEVDDYTINNMLTTLSARKPLSAQLFSRFIRMSKLTYTVNIYDNDKLLFEYRE